MSRRYEVVLTARARKNLQSIPQKIAHACLSFIDGTMSENPHRLGKPLIGSWAGHYSARREDWRIIYRIGDGRILIEIVAISHRAHSYRPR